MSATAVVLVTLCLYGSSFVKTETVSSECLYSTGQTCQCDESSIMNSTVTSLMSAMAALETSKDNLVAQFNLTRDLISSTLSMLAQRDHVINTLSSTEAMLNNSQTEFSRIYSSMNAELNQLRHQLKESEKKFTVCQVKPVINEPLLDLPFETHYCGFEDWFCNYTQPYTLHPDTWYRGSGRQNLRTGPVEDHTFGTPHGHYLFIDPTKRPYYVVSPIDETNPKNRTATLATTTLSPGEHYCLRFWYTMYGVYVNTLTVYTRNASIYSWELTEVQQMSGQVDQYWHMAELPLGYPHTSTPFNVVFKANLNSFKHSYLYHGASIIALDDVYIYNTTCVSVPKCPHGARQMTFGNQTSCYTFHVGQDTWYDAVKTCKSEAPNGHIVSVNSKEEQTFIVKSLATRSSPQPDTWFTSGNDEKVEGQFMWTDSGYPEPLTFTDWLPGQPDDVNNSQQCLALKRVENEDGYKWNDVSCDAKFSFICEIVL